MRKYAALLTSTAIAAVVALSAPAIAAPELEVKVLDNGVQVGGIITSTNGGIDTTITDPAFTKIQFTVFGIPVVDSPSLSSTTLDVSAAALTSAHTLQIQITQTGVTGFPSGVLNISDTSNALIGNITAVNQKTFIDSSNAAFGMGTLLDNNTPASFPDAHSANASVSGLSTFSETQIYTVTFGTNSLPSSYGGAMQLKAVPEPASLALLGTALVGLGAIGRRRRKKNA